MGDIEKICRDLDYELSNCDDKNAVLLSCVSEKLKSLYNTQSAQLDDVINEISNHIDTDDVEYLCKTVKRLSKCLSSNRAQLLKLIDEVNI